MKNILYTTALLLFLLINVKGETNYGAVRGVWITNIDSDFLFSRANIVKGLDLCSEQGINTVFIVVWNRGMTLYPSRIMKDLFNEEIDPFHAGRDPLRETIEEAHKRNIKVIAWFEFGFSSSYQLDGGRLIKYKPEWSAVDNKGQLVKKNGFEWMNGLHNEVQELMLSLILEVVNNYDVDGIQGDDRLPAMPVEAGYDKYTVELYKSEHNGQQPPEDYRNSEWVNWRAGKLNDFMKRIYTSVKAANKDVIVSMAPSIYPWSKEEYLQDWPSWVNNGWVEMICPQLYREDLKGYKILLDEIVDKQISKENLKKFFPGILLKLGDYYPSEDFLRSMITENRKKGVNGEVYFFFEGLRKYPALFKNLYKDHL